MIFFLIFINDRVELGCSSGLIRFGSAWDGSKVQSPHGIDRSTEFLEKFKMISESELKVG